MGVQFVGFCTRCKKHYHDLVKYDDAYLCPTCCIKLNIDKEWIKDYNKELKKLSKGIK